MEYRGQPEEERSSSFITVVFKELEGLQPHRNVAPLINPQPAAGPVSVRPYPHHHEIEIEKQCSQGFNKVSSQNKISISFNPYQVLFMPF